MPTTWPAGSMIALAASATKVAERVAVQAGERGRARSDAGKRHERFIADAGGQILHILSASEGLRFLLGG